MYIINSGYKDSQSGNNGNKPLTNFMSSLEIADMSGRNHRDVMRSIREMELSWEKISGRKFALANYQDEQGKPRPCYQLDYKECMYIAAKFNDETRAKLVLRWSELETGHAAPSYQSNTTIHQQVLPLKDQLTWVKEVSKIMKLNDASTLGMLQRIAHPFNLPVPDYTPSKGFVLSADKLLKSNGVSISTFKFNQIMKDKGYIDYRERPSKSKGVKRFPVLTDAGLKWGENQVSPHNQRETQIQYYEDKFCSLLKELGLTGKEVV